MRNRLKYWILAAFVIVSIGLFGQGKKSSLLSYSLSYIQPTLISSQGEFEFAPIYLNVEANIHYKPFDFISFSSGLGYNKISGSTYISYSSSTIERSNYQELFVSGMRLPFQVNLHFIKAPVKTDYYLKAVYTNELAFFKTVQYENDVATGTSRLSFYNPSLGVGIGCILLKSKPVGLILEGMIEKYLRFDSFNEATWYSLKFGVIR
jgi:hypothetical protein